MRHENQILTLLLWHRPVLPRKLILDCGGRAEFIFVGIVQIGVTFVTLFDLHSSHTRFNVKECQKSPLSKLLGYFIIYCMVLYCF